METLPPDVTPIRKLGFAELRMHLMHHELHGTTQGAAVLRLRGPLEVAAFRQACAGLLRRHEILQSTIERIGDEFWFCRRAAADHEAPLVALPREDEQHWQRVLEHENAPIEARTTRTLPFSLTRAQCDRLLAQSQRARLSLNSYLSAMFLLAVQSTLPQRTRFVLHTALSLRPFCCSALAADDLGC